MKKEELYFIKIVFKAEANVFKKVDEQLVSWTFEDSNKFQQFLIELLDNQLNTMDCIDIFFGQVGEKVHKVSDLVKEGFLQTVILPTTTE